MKDNFSLFKPDIFFYMAVLTFVVSVGFLVVIIKVYAEILEQANNAKKNVK